MFVYDVGKNRKHGNPCYTRLSRFTPKYVYDLFLNRKHLKPLLHKAFMHFVYDVYDFFEFHI